jgi:hypothetical protein
MDWEEGRKRGGDGRRVWILRNVEIGIEIQTDKAVKVIASRYAFCFAWWAQASGG